MIKIVLTILAFVWIIFGGVVYMFALDALNRKKKKPKAMELIILAILCAVGGLPGAIWTRFVKKS